MSRSSAPSYLITWLGIPLIVIGAIAFCLAGPSVRANPPVWDRGQSSTVFLVNGAVSDELVAVVRFDDTAGGARCWMVNDNRKVALTCLPLKSLPLRDLP